MRLLASFVHIGVAEGDWNEPGMGGWACHEYFGRWTNSTTSFPLSLGRSLRGLLALAEGKQSCRNTMAPRARYVCDPAPTLD